MNGTFELKASERLTNRKITTTVSLNKQKSVPGSLMDLNKYIFVQLIYTLYNPSKI